MDSQASDPATNDPARSDPARSNPERSDPERSDPERSDPERSDPEAAGRERWQRRFDAAAKRDVDFTTLSGLEVDPVYGPPPGAVVPEMERIGWPGEFPFTRGIHATGYRGKPWTIRQFSGFGSARHTNERYKMLLRAGGAGLSVAFDMPTLMGRDSDDTRSLGEVGHCGVAIDSAADMDVLFDGIALADTTTSMTISGPAVPAFCMYLVAAERQGADLSKLDGTLQTDIFKEYIAQKEWLFSPRPHLRLIGDLMQYCNENIPRYKPLSVSGYHIREAGSTAEQELAFTLADGFGYVELGLSRGLDVDEFAPGLSFFFDAHIDFFEEIAKFRAARRIWARWLRDVYGARTERAQRLRFHTQTAGVSLTAPQPANNVVRTAIEALAAVLGGTNSLHTNALDEVLALPGEAAAETALRTQQVIMEEAGVANVADPLGGSWYIEALTDRMEADAEAIFARIREMGSDGSMTDGILQGIENGWFIGEIAEASFAYQQKLEKGEKRIIGVNCHTHTVAQPLEILRVSADVEREQVEEITRRRAARDQAAVDATLAALVAASRTEENLVPPMLAAARAEATLGEICDALRAEWGTYTEPTAF
ncbi:MAG: methylmalonyl-CoA mutase family protein [Streptosporangiaceae bacterium]|jgi:methylmalonyl-CoA mutase N-terminal domain/subunit